MEQLPQAYTAVVKSTSQPLFAFASQFAHPVLQAIVHEPDWHPAMPCTELHEYPHEPQFATLDAVPVSHPFGVLPSQLPQPLVQLASVQMPLLHWVSAFGRLQPTPQAPQFDRVASDVSQPSDARPLQSA
jgi:hypothetical protein